MLIVRRGSKTLASVLYGVLWIVLRSRSAWANSEGTKWEKVSDVGSGGDPAERGRLQRPPWSLSPSSRIQNWSVSATSSTNLNMNSMHTTTTITFECSKHVHKLEKQRSKNAENRNQNNSHICYRVKAISGHHGFPLLFSCFLSHCPPPYSVEEDTAPAQSLHEVSNWRGDPQARRPQALEPPEVAPSTASWGERGGAFLWIKCVCEEESWIVYGNGILTDLWGWTGSLNLSHVFSSKSKWLTW